MKWCVGRGKWYAGLAHTVSEWGSTHMVGTLQGESATCLGRGSACLGLQLGSPPLLVSISRLLKHMDGMHTHVGCHQEDEAEVLLLGGVHELA